METIYWRDSSGFEETPPPSIKNAVESGDNLLTRFFRFWRNSIQSIQSPSIKRSRKWRQSTDEIRQDLKKLHTKPLFLSIKQHNWTYHFIGVSLTIFSSLIYPTSFWEGGWDFLVHQDRRNNCKCITRRTMDITKEWKYETGDLNGCTPLKWQLNGQES